MACATQSSTDHRPQADINMFNLSVIVSFFFIFAAATDVNQCPGKSIEGLKDIITLTPCKKQPCRLKKGSNPNVTIHFTPDNDMAEVKNHVLAELLGASFPFIGVDGVSVCEKIETEDGKKAPCPLKGGTKYIYKDSFPVYDFYPSLDIKVHWALQHDKKDIICFEVPIKIV